MNGSKISLKEGTYGVTADLEANRGNSGVGGDLSRVETYRNTLGI